ncbi:MAG: alpha/beta hydrolase [Rubrivivax sp.]|nr:alpha/beta hydrolase [Rubrivivax sp.]
MAETPRFEGFSDQRMAVGALQLRVRHGGSAGAPPLLLLHGFPQTGAMWRRVALRLAPHFQLVIPDLRGYGESDKPADEPGHAQQSKRAMAADLHALMQTLGHTRYAVAGHDRGGRVAHRLAMDQPQAVQRLALLDIAPTLDMYAATDMAFARAYYHWFFLIQPAPHPERMINQDPDAYLRWKIGGWGSGGASFFEPEALDEYLRCWRNPATVHAACEDYRASAALDLEHDQADRDAGRQLACELLVLWGERGVVHAQFDPLALWQARCARPVRGESLPCGHYLAEEQPERTAQRLRDFLAS